MIKKYNEFVNSINEAKVNINSILKGAIKFKGNNLNISHKSESFDLSVEEKDDRSIVLKYGNDFFIELSVGGSGESQDSLGRGTGQMKQKVFVSYTKKQNSKLESYGSIDPFELPKVISYIIATFFK